MPLQKGSSHEVVANNIAELISAGHPVDQAAAIAYKYANGEDRAAGIRYRAGDSVLLLLRAPDAGDFPLTWCFPGGKIDDGESAEQAAIRESSEEVAYTPTAPLRVIDWDGGFATFAVDLDAPFVPGLNSEHIGYVWAPVSALPTPMHPGCAATLARALSPAPLAVMDEKVIDGNGWVEIRDNPISKVGVFPYSGRQLGLDDDRIYQVLRPPEELGDPACVESFKLIPWVDEHAMLGPDRMPAERKGVQGVIGEDVFFKDGYLRANIKAFSSTLAALISAGKRELSAGYRCVYDMTAGIWNGQAYDAVQRQIRGNHLALVTEGRMGPDVAVMDKLTFTFDAKDIAMGEEATKDEGGGAGDMTLAQCVAMLAELAPQVAKLTAAMGAMSGAPKEPDGDEPTVDKAPAPAAPPASAPAAPAMDEALIMKRIAQRDSLAKQISAHIGTFDHAGMTLDSLVTYGCEKLGVKAEKGQEAAALSGFLQAKPASTPAASVALDSAVKAASFVTKHLSPKEA